MELIFGGGLVTALSMQMTGNPNLFSSVHSHVAVAPVSSPIPARSCRPKVELLCRRYGVDFMKEAQQEV
jgi:hypothetical protein